jgi:hypothetical protein
LLKKLRLKQRSAQMVLCASLSLRFNAAVNLQIRAWATVTAVTGFQKYKTSQQRKSEKFFPSFHNDDRLNGCNLFASIFFKTDFR